MHSGDDTSPELNVISLLWLAGLPEEISCGLDHAFFISLERRLNVEEHYKAEKH